MATTKSKKALCHLVCQSSAQISDEVLTQELERNLKDLLAGILSWKKPTSASTTAFTSNKGVASKLTTFIVELSRIIQVEEPATKLILQTYLSGDFRGTKDSLKKLVNDERCQKPLMTDIWQFHQSEKLYLLRVLKEILTQICSKECRPVFKKIFHDLTTGENCLKTSLKAQLRSLSELPIPVKDKFFSNDLVQAWIHFNLRLQCEILQILLLFFHYEATLSSPEDIIDLLKLFTSQKFGSQRFREQYVVDKGLIDNLGYLESILIVYLLDLPGVANTFQDLADLDQHSIWSSSTAVLELDRSIGSNLGNLPPHGPPMLAWMLSHYMVEQQIGKHKSLGEQAFQLNVIQYLHGALSSDALNANHVIVAISHGVVYSLISVLVTAFDPSKFNNDDLFNLIIKLVGSEVIADVVWKEGLDSPSGLAGHLGSLMTEFPANFLEPVKLMESMSKSSSDQVFDFLNDRDLFAENVEAVPAHFLGQKEMTFVNLYPRHKFGIPIPKGACSSSDGKYYLWKMNYSGFRILFHQVEELVGQLLQGGAKNISSELMQCVIHSLNLMENLLRNSSSKMMSSFTGKSLQVRKSCLVLVEKFAHVPNPPLHLLASCLRCLSLLPDDPELWKSLTDSGIFPLNGDNPGIIGSLLAQQECVLGEYPLTNAYLDLMLKHGSNFTNSVLFVVQEILPSYQNWRFAKNLQREAFGQKVLRVCANFLDQIWSALMKPSPNQTLINIVSIGDRVIQSAFESQNTSETGLGVELAKLVILALDLLEKLLKANKADPLAAGQLGKVIGSSNEPHFLLIVAHYIYHLQTPGLALSAVNFLSTVASLFPMSMLACLGNDAEALRDILIYRLESQTEDVALKIAILNFFTASVQSQPGLIQLLLSEGGCLKSIMSLLSHLKSREDSNDELESVHVSLAEFILALWDQNCSMAVTHLKKEADFWSLLTWPLFVHQKLSTKLNGFILRIMSADIFANAHNIDKDLVRVLEKLFDEKSTPIQSWCDLMASNSLVPQDLDQSILSAGKDSADVGIFLLASWKTLLIVLSKVQPISISPSVCHKITDSLTKSIRGQLTSIHSCNVRMTNSLSETSLILMQRWQTKCSGESMTDFMTTYACMMDEFSAAYEVLHPRARVAMLGMAAAALKFSQFKIDQETQVLLRWLNASCILVEKALSHYVDPREAILSLGLLRSLLHRINEVKDWYPILHQRSLLLTVLSFTHHALRSFTCSEIVQASLSLCLILSRSEQGCHGLLASDLAQWIWLPMSTINKKLDKDWIQVFNLALQLAINLLRVGEQHSLEHTLTVVALLQDQLKAFLTGPKNGNLELAKMDLTATSATLISYLMAYYKQWQLHHPQSLGQFYSSMTSLLHTCACLLIRPSLLNTIISQKASNQADSKVIAEEFKRVRRMSSTDLDDVLAPTNLPETVKIQNLILDTISSCLRMLLALSPDLVSLVTDDIVDHDAFEQLLQVGFSTPAFEQDESQALSYGTVISICNFSIRSLTHCERSPSPSRSASGLLPMDRKRLLMVLEQGLVLMLSQALLSLTNDKLSTRDKQLLRRELGAELGSVNETMRRYVHRGTKSPQTISGSSPTSSSKVLTKSDEQFMKFVSNIVQKVFK